MKIPFFLLYFSSLSLFAQASLESYTQVYDCQSVHMDKNDFHKVILRKNYLGRIIKINGQELKYHLLENPDNYFTNQSILSSYEIDPEELFVMSWIGNVSNFTLKYSGLIYSISNSMDDSLRATDRNYLVIKDRDEYSYYKCTFIE